MKLKNLSVVMFFLGLVHTNIQAGVAIPVFSFQHSEVIDFGSCQPRGDVKTAWKPEIQKKVTELQNLWNSDYKWILGVGMAALNQSYPVLNIHVSLIACSSTKEMNLLFQRDMRPYLLTEANSSPRSLVLLADGVMREFFRLYIGHLAAQSLTKSMQTPLIEKYRAGGESEVVIAEMHTLALQKYSYLSWPNQQDKLAKVIEFAKISAAKDRVRAWEIIEQEGVMPFVEELKAIAAASN